MSFRSSSYLLRLMILSIVIGTIPVLLLGTFAYYNSSRIVQAKVNESNTQLLQQTQLRVEQTLRTIDNSATQLLQSPVVTSVFDKEITNEDFQLVHELYNGISLIQTYERGIKDVFLYSLSKQWMISSSGVNDYSLPAFKPQLEAYAKFAAGSFWTSEPGHAVGNEHAIYFIKKYPFNSPNPTGVICVVLSSDALRELNGVIDGNLGSAFIMDERSQVIIHGDQNLVGTSLAEQPYLQKLLHSQEATGQYTARHEGEKVTVTYRKSSYNSWYYVSIASNELINKENRIIGWLTVFVCLGIMLVTFMLAWFGSKKMYGPIQTIYHKLMGMPSVADGSKPSGELQVIGEGVNYLIRNQSLMLDELKGQQAQLKEFFVQKLFSGTIKPTAFEEKLGLFGLEQPWRSMCVVAIQIDSLKDTRYEEANRDLLMFAINNIVGELVPVEQRLVPIVKSDSQVTIVGSSVDGSAFKHHIFSLADQIQKAILQYLDIRVSIGISRTFSSFEETQQAQHEAMTALKYRVGLGQESILFIEDVQPQKVDWYRYPYMGEQTLLDAIRSGSVSQAEQALHQFIEELFQPQKQHRDYQLSLMRLFVDLLKFGQELSLPMDNISQDEASLLQSLSKLRDIEEIESWFWTHFVHPYVQELGKRRECQYKQISEAIIDMITREFDSELTLEECSARINYHPHYVSRVFRQETGINFGEYLMQYRIDIAKKWLSESDMKVADIAERLQYNNSANFIRSFRKQVGMTPGQYREERR